MVMNIVVSEFEASLISYLICLCNQDLLNILDLSFDGGVCVKLFGFLV